MLKIRRWTEEQRRTQAEKIRAWRPWLKSTGPRTAQGKVKSSKNAFKHGIRSAETKAIYRYLAAGRLFLREIKRSRKEMQVDALKNNATQYGSIAASGAAAPYRDIHACRR